MINDVGTVTHITIKGVSHVDETVVNLMWI